MSIRHLFAASLLFQASVAHAASIGISKALEPDTFLKVMWQSIETTSAKSNISVMGAIAKGDPSLQLRQIDEFYAAGADGIIASTTASKIAGILVANARKAHKPLVFVNTQPPADLLGSGVAFVGSDVGEAGAMEMKEVCRRMNGKGSIVILMGELSHPAAKARTTAVHEVLKSPDCGAIAVLEEQSAGWDRAQAREIVRTWLRAGLKPDAVVANNDDMALGAVDALKDAAMKGVVVAGIDATDAALAAMQSGDLSLTVLQDAHQQGQKAVEVAKAMMAGEAVPAVTLVPYGLVTPDRAAQLVRDRAGG